MTPISKKNYKKQLKQKQLELLQLQQAFYRTNIPVILIFEGWDAAGKGGVIKRLTECLDPRGYNVHPISAPDSHEGNYHYLRRFWKQLPKKGQICIFDRSWYGRVLVERVEGLATSEEWQRAYEEITQTEKILTSDNYLILKFWLTITKDEQLIRFNARMKDPFKEWKITSEDWRNREKWDEYVLASTEMIERTHKKRAPWHVINGNKKKLARLAVLDKVIQAMKAHLEEQPLDS